MTRVVVGVDDTRRARGVEGDLARLLHRLRRAAHHRHDTGPGREWGLSNLWFVVFLSRTNPAAGGL